MNTSIRLLPCPFCASSELNYYNSAHGESIGCKACMTIGPAGEDPEALWNRRIDLAGPSCYRLVKVEDGHD